jgi:hypothetical protein
MLLYTQFAINQQIIHLWFSFENMRINKPENKKIVILGGCFFDANPSCVT